MPIVSSYVKKNYQIFMENKFVLKKLENGEYTVYSVSDGETFHPKIGPVQEARQLYLNQLNIRDRIKQYDKEFVIWDVGLGAAANPLIILENISDLTATVAIYSFDKTTEPLWFALKNTDQLTYLKGWEETLKSLINHGQITFMKNNLNVKWKYIEGDFPTLIERELNNPGMIPAANAILYDAFSPSSNPEMWTLKHFKNIHSILARTDVPCSLATYSRSTLVRVTLLMAGFYVGTGAPIGEKEETTIAANKEWLISRPLNRRWLMRAKHSTSAEPLEKPEYIQKPMSKFTLEALLSHPQFSHLPI